MIQLSDGSVMVQGGQFNGYGTSPTWYKITPDSTGSYDPLASSPWSPLSNMNQARRYFASNVLPDGRVFVMGGEYSNQTGTGTYINTGEVFDPTANSGLGKWTSITPFTIEGLTSINGVNGYYFGDDPTEVIQNSQGQSVVLCGFINGAQTYIYNPALDPLLNSSLPSNSNPWSFAGAKVTRLINDQYITDNQSDEESWVKLKDGSILSYDVYASETANTFLAERYDPSSGQWVDASPPAGTTSPGLLTTSTQGQELGPAFLLPNGNAIFFGANGNTAIYDPSTGTWSAGLPEPTDSNGNQLAMADAPGAMLPNGKILLAMSPLSSTGSVWPKGSATSIYEFDPNATTENSAYVNVTPPAYNATTRQGYFTTLPSYFFTMLVLPNGNVLLSNGTTQDGTTGTNATLAYFQYNFNGDDGGPQASWRPSIANIAGNADGSFTLSGTQLNGISEGAAYGDDAEMSSNYPIVRFFDRNFDAYFARTYDWSSTGVQTGAAPESAQFTNAPGPGVYSVQSIANGIASPPVLDVVTDASHNNITLQVDPADPGQLQVLSAGSVWSEWPLGLFNSVIVTEGRTFTSVTVDNVPANVTISEGTGSDSVNIKSVPASRIVTVYGNGNDVETVGNNGSVQSIQGSVQFLSGLGPVYAVVDDSSDPATHTTATSPVQITDAGVFGLSSGTIAFGPESLYGLTVLTGTGTNDIDVLGTNPGYTTYVQCNGSDTVTFGGASDGAQSIAGDVNLFETSGDPMNVNVDDSENSAAVPGSVYVTSGGITGLAPGAIQWNLQEVGYLTLTSNSQGTTFHVESTPTATEGLFTFGTTTLIGNGPDTVTIGDTSHTVQGIQGDALYIDSRSGSTSVIVDDSGDTVQYANVSVSLDSSTPGISYEEIGNLAPANIELEVPGPFGVIGTTIVGGTAAGGNRYQVFDTPAGGTTLLKTGAGDLVDVYGTSNSLMIDGNGANNTVVIGNSGLLTSIHGQVLIENENSGTTALTIDDSADPTNHVATPVTITSSSITGLAPATIFYVPTGLSALTINVGYNNPNYGNGTPATQSIYDILSTPSLTATTTLISGGLDTVNVGNAGSVAGIVGSLYLQNIAATSTVTHDTVLIDDSQNTSAHTFVGLDQALGQFGIVYQEISFLAPGFIYLADPDVQSARVQFGSPASGTNNVTVNNTAPDVAMTLAGSGVANTVAITGNTSGLTVQGFSSVGIGNAGSVARINGGINATSDGVVTVDDSKDQAARTVTVTHATVDNGLNPVATVSPWLTYSSLASLTIDAGTPAVNGVPTGAGNTFTVNSTATTPNGTTLNVGGGTATVTVSDAANTLDGIQGSLAVNGQGKATLTFNDEGTPTVQAYNVYANQFTRRVGNVPDMAPVSYAGVSHLIVQSGTGGTENLLGVVSTAPGTTTDF